MAKNISKMKASNNKAEKVEKTVQESSDESDDSSVVSESSSEEVISNQATTQDKPSSENEASSTDDDSSSVASSSEEEEEEEKEEEKAEKEESEKEEVKKEKSEKEEEESSEEEEETSPMEVDSPSKKDVTVKETSSVNNESITKKPTPTQTKKRPAPNKVEEPPKKAAKLNNDKAQADSAVENTVYVGQILLKATVNDIRTFFAKCGKIKDIRLGTFRDGQSKGYAYIDFLDAESKNKAKALNGSELMGRPIKVADALAKKSATEKFVKKTDTIFIDNLDSKIKEQEVREAFKKYGAIMGIQINNEKGKTKVFVRYHTKKQAANAIREMNKTELQGRTIHLYHAEDKKLRKRKNKK